MALYPVYTFQVDTFYLRQALDQGAQPDSHFSNIQFQRELATVSFRGMSQPYKHGDQFTIGGLTGQYLYENFATGSYPLLTVVSQA